MTNKEKFLKTLKDLFNFYTSEFSDARGVAFILGKIAFIIELIETESIKFIANYHENDRLYFEFSKFKEGTESSKNNTNLISIIYDFNTDIVSFANIVDVRENIEFIHFIFNVYDNRIWNSVEKYFKLLDDLK